MQTYIARHEALQAACLETESGVQTSTGLTKARAGDYLIVTPEGFVTVMDATAFRNLFTVPSAAVMAVDASAAARKAWVTRREKAGGKR